MKPSKRKRARQAAQGEGMKDTTFAKTLEKYIDSKVGKLAAAWDECMLEHTKQLGSDAEALVLERLNSAVKTLVNEAVAQAKTELTAHVDQLMADHAQDLERLAQARLGSLEDSFRVGLTSIRLDVMGLVKQLQLERYAKDVKRLTLLPTNRQELFDQVARAIVATPHDHRPLICSDVCPLHCGCVEIDSDACKRLRKEKV